MVIVIISTSLTIAHRNTCATCFTRRHAYDLLVEETGMKLLLVHVLIAFTPALFSFPVLSMLFLW